ncbi:unnamed protein product, partial [Mesorhabditis spiculigera]
MAKPKNLSREDSELPTTSFAFEQQEEADIKPEKAALCYKAWPRTLPPEACVVCGQKTTSFHYDVPSCNGCKTFFRRVIIGRKSYKCVKDGRCYEGSIENFTCRECRFRRCVAMGMNPDAIQTGQNLDKNPMYMQIRAKRRSTDDTEEDEPIKTVQVLMNPRLREDSIQHLVDELLYLETNVRKLRLSTYNPHHLDLKNVSEALEKTSVLYLAQKLKPMPDWPLKQQPRDWTKPTDTWQRPPNKKFWPFFDLLLSIEYAKTFDFFEKLGTMDQLALVRYISVVVSTITQCYYSLQEDPSAELVIYPDGTKRGDSAQSFASNLRGIFAYNLAAFRHSRIARKEFVLLKAIALCDTAVEGLTPAGSKILQEARDKYSEALLSHAMAKHGTSAGPTRFQELLAIVQLLIRSAKKHREIHLLNVIIRPPRMLSSFVEEIMDA